VPAILLADGLTPPQDLVDQCDQHQVPLLSTPVAAAQLIDLLRIYLGKKLAPTTTVHGVFLDVLGLGVLITGESGLGKSELALELISRGHGLVADDAVEFSRTAPNMIEGHCRTCWKCAAWACSTSAPSSARPRCAARCA